MTATWTSPRTWVTGELVTAAIMNAHVRDNLDWLKTPIDSGRVQFAADFTSTSTSYVDVTSVTTTFTTNGGGLLVIFRATMSNSSPAGISFQLMVDGVAGAQLGVAFTGNTGNNIYTFVEKVAALSAGSHTIKIQTKTSAGTTTIKGTTAASADPLFWVIELGD